MIRANNTLCIKTVSRQNTITINVFRKYLHKWNNILNWKYRMVSRYWFTVGTPKSIGITKPIIH